LATYSPEQSGYGDPMGNGALDECTADLDALFGSIDVASTFVTRMHGELARAAFGTDLQISASADQSPISGTIVVKKTTGTAPVCPTYPPCGDSSGGGGFGGDGGASMREDDSGCAFRGARTTSAAVGAIGLLALLSLRRCRSKRAA